MAHMGYCCYPCQALKSYCYLYLAQEAEAVVHPHLSRGNGSIMGPFRRWVLS